MIGANTTILANTHFFFGDLFGHNRNKNEHASLCCARGLCQLCHGKCVFL